MYKIRYTKQVLKDLQSFPKRDQKAILKKIETLSQNPRPPGTKALHGEWGGFHRIRIGDYRVIYNIEDKTLVISVVKIGQRGHVYED